MNIVRINKNINKITIPYKDIFTSVYTIKTKMGTVLFDCASYDSDGEDYILPMLHKTGCEDIKYIFISHNHRDHSGALGRILGKYPEAIILSASENLKEKYSKYTVISPCDGEIIENDLEVCKIPGHSEDSMALFDRRTKTLITGDCLQCYGIFGSEDWGANIGMPKEYFEALEKLGKMDINEIHMAHSFYPCGIMAYGKKQVSQVFENCRKPLLKVRELISENPEKSDLEIRGMYNKSAVIPPISAGVVVQMRKWIEEV